LQHKCDSTKDSNLIMFGLSSSLLGPEGAVNWKCAKSRVPSNHQRNKDLDPWLAA